MPQSWRTQETELEKGGKRWLLPPPWGKWERPICVPAGEGSHACAPLYLSVIGEEDTVGQEKGGNRVLNIFSFLYLLPAKPRN